MWSSCRTVLGRLAAAGRDVVLTNRWGGQALVSLYISILSGIVVALQYDAAEPFYSTASIDLVIPFGAFWRSLHYYSSQLFFLLLSGHLLAVIWKNDHGYPRSSWIRLCLSLPVTILLLFTGYVLRGDATGEAAGIIAENICLSIPLIGETLNSLFFDTMASGVRKIYVHHLIGLMVLGAYTIWPHLRKYPVGLRHHLLTTAALILVSVLLVAPMEPARVGLTFIAGPWFFLGLQELLFYLPTFIAGVIAPLTLVAALLLFPANHRQQRPVLLFMALWGLLYLALTLLCYWRI
jgi:ubiquinol-cytochrome c reductase cytochrome b subunit